MLYAVVPSGSAKGRIPIPVVPDALAKKMTEVGVAFEVLEEEMKAPIG